jgi:4-amino-4-deoxy-L-arabinose transferase-like glycosyltransferase
VNSGRELHSSLPAVLPSAASLHRTRIFNGVAILVTILVVATGLRVASALYQGNEVTDLPGIFDQISYDGLARRVVAGYGFSFAEGHWPTTRAGEPTAHWSYLYTLYLAGIYSVFGFQPVVARLLQAVIAGLLHPWLTWRLGRRVFGPRVGLVAAALSAIYIYFVYYAGGLLTESFYFLGVLWSLDCAMRITTPGGQRKRRLWLELGLALGVTALLRQLFLLFAPFLFLWIWWNLSPEHTSTERPSFAARWVRWPVLRGLLAAGLVIVALIAPWTIRNYRAFGIFVPLNTNAGFAFYWGNHPIHGTQFMPLLPAGGPSYQDLIPPELLPLNEGQLDQTLLKEGLRIVAGDPVRYLLLSLSRVREYFKFWPSPESGLISNVSRVGSFGLLLPFMVYGLWISAKLMRGPEHPAQRSQLLLLYLFMAVYTTLHLLTWTLIRYRLPVDTILLCFAALSVVRAANTILDHSSRGIRPMGSMKP